MRTPTTTSARPWRCAPRTSPPSRAACSALIVLFNREKRYDEALAQLAILRERYPRNRLSWLESGSTSLRAGKAADGERFLDEGISKLAGDTRPRMFGEEA